MLHRPPPLIRILRPPSLVRSMTVTEDRSEANIAATSPAAPAPTTTVVGMTAYVRALRKYGHLYQQAMEGYAGARRRTRRTQRKPATSDPQAAVAAEIQVTDSLGDPRFLEQARKALENDRRCPDTPFGLTRSRVRTSALLTGCLAVAL